ncbi:hypothetical protein HBH98_229410 [Parastagonospora nodorum]|nr:hypothetical protein HBI02_082910 [Parastagonospora nodorum]KAH4336349.1 hypothetical protein HBH98_229410 [Parastagonospora nodorum]KAH4357915.1 hypothetical protein HBH97_220610 [Parastagonospora nodorum]KAH4473209.1 hypothetical protein HBH90_039870 [Parastagonospora nodorum]KAH4501168.1 hypothetical protein HBH88_074410 [Parastagonospora nodorum]
MSQHDQQQQDDPYGYAQFNSEYQAPYSNSNNTTSQIPLPGPHFPHLSHHVHEQSSRCAHDHSSNIPNNFTRGASPQSRTRKPHQPTPTHRHFQLDIHHHLNIQFHNPVLKAIHKQPVILRFNKHHTGCIIRHLPAHIHLVHYVDHHELSYLFYFRTYELLSSIQPSCHVAVAISSFAKLKLSSSNSLCPQPMFTTPIPTSSKLLRGYNSDLLTRIVSNPAHQPCASTSTSCGSSAERLTKS